MKLRKTGTVTAQKGEKIAKRISHHRKNPRKRTPRNPRQLQLAET
jgi:hypothetical protein